MSNQAGWPYMPPRDTNHIRIIREYRIDSTGKRTLTDITEYDRHGYQTNPNIKLTYNDKGQLIHWLKPNNDTTMPQYYQLYCANEQVYNLFQLVLHKKFPFLIWI